MISLFQTMTYCCFEEERPCQPLTSSSQSITIWTFVLSFCVVLSRGPPPELPSLLCMHPPMPQRPRVCFSLHNKWNRFKKVKNIEKYRPLLGIYIHPMRLAYIWAGVYESGTYPALLCKTEAVDSGLINQGVQQGRTTVSIRACPLLCQVWVFQYAQTSKCIYHVSYNKWLKRPVYFVLNSAQQAHIFDWFGFFQHLELVRCSQCTGASRCTSQSCF